MTNPCSERWDDMPQTGAGRYCDSCEKNIIDLSAKSDAELIQFFKKKKDNVCGRLLASQLNRELVLEKPKASWQWLLPLAIGAIVSTPTQAQELRPVIVQSDQAANSSSQEVPVKQSVPVQSISGKVVHEKTGEPLKGVKIKQKGFENVLALTDHEGKFELSTTPADTVTAFIFELSGYGKVESKLNDGMVIRLPAELILRLGGVSTISLHREPLYLVFVGKKSCVIDAAKLKEISPDWIEDIEILKDAKATALYGSKAANGVVLVEIKKAYAKKIDFSKKKLRTSVGNPY